MADRHYFTRMSSKPNWPRKRSLSFHQKQNRFFVVLSIFLAAVAFTVFLWLINRPPHFH